MATEVYTTEVIILQDGTEVELRPLPISKMRKFSRMWAEHMGSISKHFNERSEEGEDEVLIGADITDDQYTAFIKMCALGLESQLKESKTDKQFLAYLEDVLDEPTIQRILKVTGGLELGDPNQKPPANPVADGMN